MKLLQTQLAPVMPLARSCRWAFLSAVMLLSALLPGAPALGAPASITTQPMSVTVLQGSPATFSVVAAGTAPINYQWFRDGGEIVGANSDSYALPATVAGDNGAVFSVIVTNAEGGQLSSNAVLTIDPGVLVTGTSNLINISTHVWRYFTNGVDQGTAWKEIVFNDTAWRIGVALFGLETTPGLYAEPFRSQFPAYNPAIPAHYFRTTFNYTAPTGNIASINLRITGNVDDGCVFYLNGAEIASVRMPAGRTFATLATGDNEGGTEVITLDPGTNLVAGVNTLAVDVHQQSTASSDLVFGMSLDALITFRVPDTTAPTIIDILPAPGQTVLTLNEIEIFFSEEVQGVDAADLRINMVGAASVANDGPGQWRFTFTQPMTGNVTVAWAPMPGITDMALNPNAFVPGPAWNYTLNPNASGGDVRISEFMARNQDGLRDQDGDTSDWIELHNASPIAIDLGGWFLTDDKLNLTKFRIPNGTFLGPNSYLIIFASDKTGTGYTNPPAPIHTGFALNSGPAYLGLVSPATNIISQFDPYPGQVPDVSYGRDRILTNQLGFYVSPTPGAQNNTSGPGFAPPVEASVPSGTFVTSFPLALSTASTGAVIRYVLITNLPAAIGNAVATNVPTETSPIYTNPIQITATTQIRARTFETGRLPGEIITFTYIQIGTDMLSFSSDIPICVIHTLGANSLSSGGDQAGAFMIFDSVKSRASVTNKPELHTRMGINTRGASTGGQPKSNFAVEFWDEFNQDADKPFLDMPEESDWVLYGINGFDPGLMHNAIYHWIGRQIPGQTASRTRYVEVFRKTGLGPVTTNDYFGLYLVLEKPKRDNDRLDITSMQLEDTNAPAVTGGYLLRIDRTDPNEWFFQPPTIGSVASTPANVIIDYPLGPYNNFIDPRAHIQSNYIRGQLQAFLTNLASAGYTHPTTGYVAYIDTDHWVDNLIGNMIPFNVDGYRLSGYFHKDRNERFRQGPFWDCDRCLGTGGSGATPQADNRPFNPRLWRVAATSAGTDNGTDFFGLSSVGVSWFQRLFRDPDFWQKWIDRYQELRVEKFSNGALTEMVDNFHAEIQEAQVREQARWAPSGFTYPRSGVQTAVGYTFDFGPANNNGRGAFAKEVEFQKLWLLDRMDFLDTNFLNRPTLSLGDTFAPGGTNVTVTPATKPGTLLLYTLDGTDPRLPGGAVSPSALTNVGPLNLAVSGNVRLFARCFNPLHSNVLNAGSSLFGNPLTNSFWSGPMVATYFTQVPPLRITELMYHPLPPPPGNTNDQDNFEYIEVKNISMNPLNLLGFRLRGGVDFDFPNVNLAGGQSAVIVRHLAAFISRYGGDPLILGVYTNDNLANGGDNLRLEGPLREPILDFDYEDDWYPVTDGLGFSLAVVDENAPLANWDLASHWRPSGALGGSPGTNNPAALVFPRVVVNEVRAHTDPNPPYDAIELLNLAGGPADISGWYLTDDFDAPKKYRIPAMAPLADGATVLFDETHFNTGPNAFSLSSLGEEVYLFSADVSSNLTGYAQGFDFGASFNGTTFGRYIISTGSDQYPEQASPSLGAPNTGPRVGPVVINEILYRPVDIIIGPRVYDNDCDEFIELCNTTGSPVPLFDPMRPTNTWRLRNAVDFDFPTNVYLTNYLLVVPFDPADSFLLGLFRAHNSVPPGVPIYGPYEGKLDNSEEAIELRRPDRPEPPASPNAGTVPYPLVERVRYQDMAPWPPAADGSGPSLQRRLASAYGNDPSNWVAAARSPGAGVLGGDPPSILVQPVNAAVVAGQTAMFSVTAGGPGPRSYQWRRNGQPLNNATNALLVLNGVQTSQAGRYSVVVMNGGGSAVSSDASLTVFIPASVLRQPTNVTVRVRPDPNSAPTTNASFSVFATSLNPPLTFQWMRDGTNIPGATATNYTVTNVTVADESVFNCAITDGVGTILSSNAHLNVWITPFVTSVGIVTNIAVTNAMVTFGVTYEGHPLPFRYEWRLGSTPFLVRTSNLRSDFVTIQATNRLVTNLIYRTLVNNAAFPSGGSGSAFATNALFTVIDSDGDGLPDIWETTFGAGDPNADGDGDGMTNLEEYFAGTDPISAASVLKIEILSAGAGASLQFGGISNRTYAIQYADQLRPQSPQEWQRLAEFTARRTAFTTNVIDPAYSTNRFYRAVTPRQ
jgi:hypothetical protein